MIFRALALLALASMSHASVAKKAIDGCFVSEQKGQLAVSLEVARTANERRKGLMGRESLATNHGMLFIYPSVNEPQRGFWMRNTLIPLDIAYLGADQRIASIRTMQPCRTDSGSDCPAYPAGVPFQYAVEMNAGFFDDQRFKIGDRLVWGSKLPVDCQTGSGG